jgi:hypothetical protein
MIHFKSLEVLDDKKAISKKAKVLVVEESDSDAQARLEILKKCAS